MYSKMNARCAVIPGNRTTLDCPSTSHKCQSYITTGIWSVSGLELLSGDYFRAC